MSSHIESKRETSNKPVSHSIKSSYLSQPMTCRLVSEPAFNQQAKSSAA